MASGFVVKKNGRFIARLGRVKDPETGKVHEPQATFGTEREANKWVVSEMKKVNDGAYRRPRRMTVEVLLLEHFLPAVELGLATRAPVRPATVSQYAGVARNWVLPVLGSTEVADLSEARVLGFKKALLAKGLSRRSVQMAMALLKQACAWGAKMDKIAHDPLANISRGGAKSPAMKAWSVEETKQFLAFVADDRLAVAWALLLGLGLRRGELCGLRWGQVDLSAGWLRVGPTRIVVDGRVVESDSPKTAGSARPVKLSPELVALMRAHRARQGAEKLAAGSSYHDDGYVIADEVGKPYYPGWVSVSFKRRAQEAGVPVIRLHDGRHTAASRMLANETPVHVVAEVLGHSSPNITLSVYAHILPGQREEAAERDGKLLFG
jgi:integrase